MVKVAVRKHPKSEFWISVLDWGSHNKSKAVFKKIDGDSVDFAGFEKYDFFIHRSQGNDKKSWLVVSEGKTGMRILNVGHKTRKEAYEEGLKVLEREGRKNLDKAIKSSLKQYGVSPRWAPVELVGRGGRKMRCKRCKGMLVWEDFYSEDDRFLGFRCVNCGEVIDSEILINRGVSFKGGAGTTTTVPPVLVRERRKIRNSDKKVWKYDPFL